jgi:hypothetical protein
MMRVKRVVLAVFIVLILAGLGRLFVNECTSGGGMGAAYKSCECSGIEWELYDRTAADRPRKTLCVGIVRSRACYQYTGGPQMACDGDPQVIVKTDKAVYALEEDIAIAIENHLSEPISYDDPCSLTLCHLLGGDWLCEMEECHSPTVMMEAGSTAVTRMQVGESARAKLRYRLDYRASSEGILYTVYSNEFALEPKNIGDAGYSLYVRELIPGEAWLEDGTTLYFESPTLPTRAELQGNAISLDVRVGRKDSRSVTGKIWFTMVLLGENALQVDCPKTNVRVELENHIERAVHDAIMAYEPITVPKHQWVGIFSDGTHNAPKYQLWWGELPPPE